MVCQSNSDGGSFRSVEHCRMDKDDNSTRDFLHFLCSYKVAMELETQSRLPTVGYIEKESKEIDWIDGEVGRLLNDL